MAEENRPQLPRRYRRRSGPAGGRARPGWLVGWLVAGPPSRGKPQLRPIKRDCMIRYLGSECRSNGRQRRCGSLSVSMCTNYYYVLPSLGTALRPAVTCSRKSRWATSRCPCSDPRCHLQTSLVIGRIFQTTRGSRALPKITPYTAAGPLSCFIILHDPCPPPRAIRYIQRQSYYHSARLLIIVEITRPWRGCRLPLNRSKHVLSRYPTVPGFIMMSKKRTGRPGSSTHHPRYQPR